MDESGEEEGKVVGGWRRRGREAERGDRMRATEWMDSRFGWPRLAFGGIFRLSRCAAARPSEPTQLG